MRSCSSGIEDLAGDVGATFWSVLDGGWPKLFLIKPEWKTSELPKLGVGLQWKQGAVGFATGERPVVGVWVDQNGRDLQLSQALKARFRAGQLLERPWQSSSWWPAWRYETANGIYWDDLDPFRAQLVQAVHTTWERYIDAIDSTLEVP